MSSSYTDRQEALGKALNRAMSPTGHIMVLWQGATYKTWFIEDYSKRPDTTDAAIGTVRYILPNGEVTKLS